MKINQITQKLGISRKAILYYEAEGLIKSTRTENNYRQFDSEQLEKLKIIYKLRLADVPVLIIKEYLTSSEIGIVENYIIEKRQNIESQLLAVSQLDLTKLKDDYIGPISALDYISENIDGPLGTFISAHYKYYLEKDKVTYQGNEQVFKEMIKYVETHDWTAVNKVLKEYPVVEVPNTIHDHSYKYIASLNAIPTPSPELVQEVERAVNPVKKQLSKINYYTEFVPLIKQLSPSYCLYLEKVEWLESKRLESEDK